MKQTGFIKRKTALRKKSKSDTALAKDRIQSLLRQIVIKRDGGCILRNIRHCGGEIGQAVLQADHLITRANSATYADSRLVVCVCRACHGGYKKWHKEAYDALVRTIISKERVRLWDKCEKESWQPNRKYSHDWKLAEIALEAELKKL